MSDNLLPPRLTAFISSMRSIGYSLNTAAADIIDNSITAHADTIEIFVEYAVNNESTAAFVDNGHGMNREELLEAMRWGSKSPEDARDKNDLGRFGLGLKTASFSVCRRLTAVSAQNGIICSLCWDLDVLAERNSWNIIELSESQVKSLPHIDRLGENGTLILWQKIDKIPAKTKRSFNQMISRLREHLELTFHRFLKQEKCLPAIIIKVNDTPLEPVDPYHLNNEATQTLQMEKPSSGVVIQPYILASRSKCQNDAEYQKYAGRGGYIANQGFYVYRGRRLLTHGTWFRLAQVDDLNQLARVSIEITNEDDLSWQVDIKKSTVTPPDAIKDILRRIIDEILEKAHNTYAPRLRKTDLDDAAKMWNRFEAADKTVYRINRGHSLVQKVRGLLSEQDGRQLDQLLKVIEQELPIKQIIIDDIRSQGREPDENRTVAVHADNLMTNESNEYLEEGEDHADEDIADLTEKALQAAALYCSAGIAQEKALNIVLSKKIFSKHRDEILSIIAQENKI